MSLSRPLHEPGKGLRFLSFDGGGIRAISQALMVKEMMYRIEVDCQLPTPPKVCDYFDMICGSGFGGILAIMCGILKMTGEQLVQEFVALCEAVFSEGLDVSQRTTIMQREIKRIIGRYSTGGEERRMIYEDDSCKTFVCAAASCNTDHARLFRNYRARANPSLDCMLWEATCATTSMPDLFNPIVIGGTRTGEKFVGGELRSNNPMNELTKEAVNLFSGLRISTIISIGSGHIGHMSMSKGLADLFSRIALDCEHVTNDMKHRFGDVADVFWRLNVTHGLENLAGDLSNLDEVVSHTHSYLGSAQTTSSIDTLVQDLVQCPERVPVDRISRVVPAVFEPLRRKLCPPPTQYFTGRRSEIKKLDEYFSPDRKSTSCRVGVLYGIGGGGKSQMGLEFIRQSNNRDTFFVDASDKFTLENDLKTIAIGVSDRPTVEDALHILRTTRDEWLLFLDNADDPSLDLRPYIMWPHGNVLITTRNREVRMHAPDCNIRVDQLELNDAVDLLLRGVDVDKTLETYKTASEIVQKLGCLALAVKQAHGFLAQGMCTLSEYLPIYMRNRKKLLEDGAIQTTDDYKRTVYTTWTISFNKLSPLAMQLLELLCFMHHEGIPIRIFEDAWKMYTQYDGDDYDEDDGSGDGEHDEYSEDDEDDEVVPTALFTFLSSFWAVDSTWDILRFRTLIREIVSFSLIEFNPRNYTFSLHPLVQQWAQNQCRHSREVIRSTQTLLSLATPMGQSKDDFVMTLSLLPHLRASNQTGLDVHFTHLQNFGVIYYRGGMFQESAAVYEQEKSRMQEEFGFEHPNALTSMNNLASSYSHLGQHKDALKLKEQVLALRARILGEEHPDTLESIHNLAATYSDLGQHQDALKLKEQVLALCTQILGEEHPHTLISMNNLASTYSHLGQHKDALKLKEQVLALRARILGEEHPDTLISMNNLATTYADLGELKDALKLQKQILALRTRILGGEHPRTLTSMSNLVATYSDLGEHMDALKLEEQVLALRTQILGEEHPDTLTSMNNLARTYSYLGQRKHALTLEVKVLALRIQIQGEEHPDTLTSMNNLASTYSDLGQHKEALKLNEQVLALSTRILGKEHPDTLTRMNNLASIYFHLGQLKDALKLGEQVLAISTRILGEENPRTLEFMHNLEGTLLELNQHEQPLSSILGPEHPDAAQSTMQIEQLHDTLANEEPRQVLGKRKRLED